MTLRGEASRAFVRFLEEGNNVRPSRIPVVAQADAWIQDLMDDETAAEYFTGADDDPDALLDGEPLGEADISNGAPGPGSTGLANELEVMRRRMAEMEAQLRGQVRAPATVVDNGGTATRSRSSLLGAAAPPGKPVDAVLEQLRMYAGPGPGRLGAHEKALRLQSPAAALDVAQQENSLEATNGEELDEALAEAVTATTDPLHRLLAIQMQQTAMLTKHLKGKTHADPVQAALATGSTDSGSNSVTGVKGCLARDAYVKLTSNLLLLAQTGEENAARELGLSRHQIGPGMMRDYVERRMPLGDFRLMTQMSYLMASFWETGFVLNNKELQGEAVKGLMFLEQACIDNGRAQMAWLMTGLAEPQFHLCQKNRTVQGAVPFARLPAPAWVAANVAFLKDFDFMQNRIKTGGNGNPRAAPEDKDPGDKIQATPKPKKKAWKKQQPKGEEQVPAQ